MSDHLNIRAIPTEQDNLDCEQVILQLRQQLASVGVALDELRTSNAKLNSELLRMRSERNEWRKQANHWHQAAAAKDAAWNRIRSGF